MLLPPALFHRWKNLWKHTSKLNFLDHHLYSQLVFQFSGNYCLVELYQRQIEVLGKNINWVNSVLQWCETLIITLYHPMASFSVPEMPKLNKLVVYYRYVELEQNAHLPVTCFIEASPCLEEFKLELAINRNVFEIPKDGPIFQHRYLKRFVLSCGGAGDRIDLVRYIVDSCIALEEIVIGQCDCEGLVRHIVDYCVPLDDIIISPEFPHQDYVARRDIQQTGRRFVPAHVKLCVV